MNALIGLFISLTLFTTMVALGLSLRSDAVVSWLRSPGLPLRLLLASCMLMPLLALLLLQSPWNHWLSRPARYAIALMALCPSAPLAMHKARQVGGDHQLAAVVQVAAALAAIVSVPVLGLAFRHSFAVEGWQISPRDVAQQVATVQVLPVLLGLGLSHWWPRLSSELERPLNRIANLLLVLLFALLLAKAAPLLVQLVPANLPAVLLMALLAWAALLLGRAMAGGEPDQRLSAGLVTAMRNPGLALLLANRHGGDLEGLRLLFVLHVLITIVVSQPWIRQQRAGQAPWRGPDVSSKECPAENQQPVGTGTGACVHPAPLSTPAPLRRQPAWDWRNRRARTDSAEGFRPNATSLAGTRQPTTKPAGRTAGLGGHRHPLPLHQVEP